MKLKTIQRQVERKLSIDLQERIRKRPNVYARSVYFRLCKDLTRNTVTDIARSVGMNHASVLHSFKLFDDVIRNFEPDLFEVYSEIKDELEEKPLLYDSPTRYWMEKNYDLQMKFNTVVEDYEKLYTKATFFSGQLKRMGFTNSILDEPIRRHETEEAGRTEEQRSSQRSLQGTGEAYQSEGEGPESNDPVCVEEDIR
jgi:hypothetical protein